MHSKEDDARPDNDNTIFNTCGDLAWAIMDLGLRLICGTVSNSFFPPALSKRGERSSKSFLQFDAQDDG